MNQTIIYPTWHKLKPQFYKCVQSHMDDKKTKLTEIVEKVQWKAKSSQRTKINSVRIAST